MLLIITSFQTVLSSGLTLGWSGMVLMHEEDRTFEAMCTIDTPATNTTLSLANGDEPVVCNAIKLKLSFMYTVANALYVQLPTTPSMCLVQRLT